jgi:hypothetical protein
VSALSSTSGRSGLAGTARAVVRAPLQLGPQLVERPPLPGIDGGDLDGLERGGRGDPGLDPRRVEVVRLLDPPPVEGERRGVGVQRADQGALGQHEPGLLVELPDRACGGGLARIEATADGEPEPLVGDRRVEAAHHQQAAGPVEHEHARGPAPEQLQPLGPALVERHGGPL